MVQTQAERARAYRARRKATGWKDLRGNRRPKSIDAPFVGCDGEGGNIGGVHKYLTLRVGDQELVNPDRSPLGTWQILNWLCNLPRRDCNYVGFFFTYDVTQILSDLARENPYKLHRLMNRNSRRYVTKDGYAKYWPVDWRGFEFDFLPGKYFEVRRQAKQGQQRERYVHISDVGSFFQCSFVKALETWKVGTESQLETIRAGKAGRTTFAELEDVTRAYNALEIDLLEQLMDKFREACHDADMVPQAWEGPGQTANAILNKYEIITAEEVQAALPKELLDAANDAYFGGRFEITSIGHVDRPVYQHDINSAYPYAATLLPCLRHGQWEHASGEVQPTGLYLARGSFSATRKVNLYGLPHRNKKGNICWPGTAGEGWYWSHEIEASIYQKFDQQEVWVYRANCNCQPFGWIPEKYQERKALGKNAKGLTIKLGLNSIYGKTCQSIGSPKFANPIYASLFTSITRAQLYRRCIRLGLDSVLMLATDGIFTTSDIECDVDSDKLGEWEVGVLEKGIFIIQPGLYIKGTGEMKTRGVPLSKVQEYESEFYSQYRKLFLSFKHRQRLWMDTQHRDFSGFFNKFHVEIPIVSLINIKLVVFRNKHRVETGDYSELGQWVPATKHISFDWRTKRASDLYELDGRSIRVQPIKECLELNKAYDKDIGARIERDILMGGILQDPDSPDFVFEPEEI